MPPIYANGHISGTGGPIHFMFGSRVEFSGTADRTALLRLNKSKMAAAAMLEKFQMAIMALFSIRTNSRWRPPPSWIILNGHISATAHDL